MLRAAILALLVFYCAQSYSQQFSVSRNFQTVKKNIPLGIINNHDNYFYLLRCNKLAHDVIIERRRKPDAEIIAFCPLRLDSVNAHWFDYENLDYLFFESHDRAYFVFEKVLNDKRTIYLKSCDTLGKSSAFAEVASIVRDKNTRDFYFRFKLLESGKILIVATRSDMNDATRKLVMLYDPQNRIVIWKKPLPVENPYTGYSTAYDINNRGDLFYIMVKSRLVGYRRHFSNQQQTMVPVLRFDSLALYTLPATRDTLRKWKIGINAFDRMNSLRVMATDSAVTVCLHFAIEDTISGKKTVYFVNQGFGHDPDSALFYYVAPLKPEIAAQLQFYDGGDSNEAADKLYSSVESIVQGQYIYQVSERKDDNYYKELLLLKVNGANGFVEFQGVVPRKIFFYPGRTRFRNLGLTNSAVCDNVFYTILLEHRANGKIPAKEYDYRKFNKQQYTNSANVVMYYLEGDSIKKKVLMVNEDYEWIPLNYRGNQCDFVLYQSRGKVERFVILPLNQP
jgi:hypothetical protein